MPPDEDSRTVALYFELDRLRIDLYLPHLGPLAHVLENLLEDHHRLTALLLDIGAFALRPAAVFVVVLVTCRRRRTRAPRASVGGLRVNPASPLIIAPARPPIGRAFLARRRRRLRNLRDLRIRSRLPAADARRIRALARHSHPRLPRAHSEHAGARCREHFDRNLVLARAELL